MTDEELERVTAPTHYTNQAPPIPGAGLTVSVIEQPIVRHRCGYCNNGTGVFNPACPNAKGAS